MLVEIFEKKKCFNENNESLHCVSDVQTDYTEKADTRALKIDNT